MRLEKEFGAMLGSDDLGGIQEGEGPRSFDEVMQVYGDYAENTACRLIIWLVTLLSYTEASQRDN